MATNQTENSLPKTLVFSKDLAAKATKKAQIVNEGFVRFAVTGAKNREGKNKDQEGNDKIARYQMMLTLAPLTDSNNPKSAQFELAVQKYLVLPQRTPNSPEPDDMAAEEQAQADTLKRLTKDLRAILGTKAIPAPPKKLSSGRYEYDETEIDASDYPKALADSFEKAQEVAAKFWADSDRWLTPKRTVWAKVAPQVDFNGELRTNIVALFHELPSDATELDYSEWFKPAPIK